MAAAHTAIQWTDTTWNPTRGCSRVSPGCENCYAERVAAHPRMSLPGKAYHGLALLGPHGPRWTRKVAFVPDALLEPLSWKKPRRVFVNSMSDLFHESLTNEQIAAVFAVMAASRRHTFQVLTKRAGRMFEWHEWAKKTVGTDAGGHASFLWQFVEDRRVHALAHRQPLPSPNVWLGVSVEDDARACDRIPLLLATPAAVRFVSYEPALGPIAWRDTWLYGAFDHCPDETDDPAIDECAGCPAIPGDGDHCGAVRGPHIDWIIVGGESGPGARPFDTAWAHRTVDACARAGVACFVKQMGARPLSLKGAPVRLKDHKGGDISEWPTHLRVRQYPDGGSARSSAGRSDVDGDHRPASQGSCEQEETSP
jgi:protein gp37